MKVSVLFESRTGNTERVAEYIGGAAAEQGAEVTVHSVTRPDLGALAAADIVYVGTWTDGLFFVGQRPGGENNLVQLPWLDRKKVATFCTYAINPGKTAEKVGALMAAKGAEVVGSQSFNRRNLTEGVDSFVKSTLAKA